MHSRDNRWHQLRFRLFLNDLISLICSRSARFAVSNTRVVFQPRYGEKDKYSARAPSARRAKVSIGGLEEVLGPTKK